MKKKGQISIEYIATYGWAIIIVLGALGALFYLNAFDLSPYAKSQCNFYSGIYCDEFLVQTNQVTLVLQNGLPIDITDVSVSLADCGLATGQTTLTSGESTQYVISCTHYEGEVMDSTLTFNYTNPDSGINHTKVGQLRSTVK